MIKRRLVSAAAVLGAAAILVSTVPGLAQDTPSYEEAAQQATEPATYVGPTDSPPVATDKTVAVILCAAAAEGCVRIGNGFSEAAAVLGWQVKTLDGQGQASVYNTVMRQAIAEQVDGIVLVAIDSKLVGDAMAEATSAGIPVVSVVGGNTAGPGDVFSEVSSQAQRGGEQLGNWLVANSGESAVVAMFHAPEFTDSRRRYEGGKSIIDTCAGCTIASDTQYVASTAAQDLPTQTKSILQANPEIDWIFTDIGGYGAAQVQAINELGVADTVKLVSFDCNPQDLTNIRDGNVQVACDALQLEAGGWGAADELNRAFNGAPAGGDVIPIKVITKDNAPEGDNWDGDFDFRAQFQQLWGVGG